MIKRYKKATLEYKALYFSKSIAVKSYLTGFVFAFLICLILYMPLINMMFLAQFFNFTAFLILLTTLLLIYLMLFFKDKALNEYVPESKEVDLFAIRMGDFLIISIACIIIYFIVIIVANCIMGW